jgi:trehalose 6-phosphate phosphatase
VLKGSGPLPIAADQIELKQFIRKVAESERSALLLDYDGTLAPFSVDRQKALPYPGIVPVIQEIMASGRTRVVIVTGRSAHEVVPLLGIYPHPVIWGTHGLEQLQPDGTYEMSPLGEDASNALTDADRWLSARGLQSFAEHKPGSIAVHWRGLAESRALELRQEVLRGWFPIAQQALLAVSEFDGGVEMRVPDLDKGDAVRAIATEMGHEIPIAYLGDDTTDERAFDAVANRGLSVLVRPEWRKTSAQAWLRPPEELLDFLTGWMDACYNRPPQIRRRMLTHEGAL